MGNIQTPVMEANVRLISRVVLALALLFMIIHILLVNY